MPEASDASLATWASAASIRVSWFWAGGGFWAASGGLLAAAAASACAPSFAGPLLSAVLGASGLAGEGLGAERLGGALGVSVALGVGLAERPSPRSTRGATLGALALGGLGWGAGLPAVAVLEVRVVLSLAGLLWGGQG